MHIRDGPVRVSRLEKKSKLVTYQRSKFWSRQSCSQAVDGDEGAFEPLHSAAYEQLWLAYKAMEPTARRRTIQLSNDFNSPIRHDPRPRSSQRGSGGNFLVKINVNIGKLLTCLSCLADNSLIPCSWLRAFFQVTNQWFGRLRDALVIKNGGDFRGSLFNRDFVLMEIAA
jgi:hypothetical protein